MNIVPESHKKDLKICHIRMPPMFFQERNVDYSLIMDLPDPDSFPVLCSASKNTEQSIDYLTIRKAF